MKKTSFSMIVYSVLLVCCALPVSPAYSAGGKDPLLDLLPDNTLFCVRINNFTGSLELLDQYLAGASSIPVSMMFNMFLGGALGDPMMNGVNKYGTLALVGIGSGEQPEPIAVFLLPVTDPKPFTSNPNCKGPDEKGLYTLASPGSPVGPLVFVPLENHSCLLVGTEDKKAAVQSAKALFKDKKKSLAQRINAVDAQNAASAPAWVWLNLETGYAMVAPLIRKGVEEGMKQGAAGMNEQTMKGMIDGLDQWMRQTDSLSVMLTPAPDLLTAEVNFMPKPDTALAAMLVRDPAMKTGFKMGGYLDPQAQISGLMNMNKPLWKKINEDFIGFFSAGMGTAEERAELTAQFKAMMDKGIKAMGTEAAFSFGYAAGTPPFAMREVVEINDSKTMRELIKESTGLVNKLYGSMGVPATFAFKEKVGEYKGVSLDQAVVNFTFPDDSIPPAEKAVIEAMYGKEGLIYPIATTDKALFLAMGPQSDAELKKMLDMRSSLPGMPADMQTVMKIIPRAETADLVMSLNVVRLMKGMSEMMTKMAQTAPEGASGPPFAQMLEGIAMNTQSTMAVGSRVDGGRVQTHLALPKQHLMEIMAVTMQIQQKIMMQQMQPQSQPASPGSN